MSESLNKIGNTARPSEFGHAGGVVNIYKNIGETPRERLERLREQRRDLRNEVLSYAGRLDPMAEGVLLCLVGSANSRREAYLDMSKEYVLDVLFGFSTDTYDVLGKVVETGDTATIKRTALLPLIQSYRGDVSQEYPPYSSKTVEGKSLPERRPAASILPHQVTGQQQRHGPEGAFGQGLGLPDLLGPGVA